MAERVRLRKLIKRTGGGQEELADSEAVEGLEVSPPVLGTEYSIRAGKDLHEEFSTSVVRAVVTDAGGLTLVCDDYVYALEVVGH